MPWCPKCKNEYVEGILTCADCGCELVDSLEDTEEEAGKAESFQDIFSEQWEDDESIRLPEDIANAVRMGKAVSSAASGGVYENSSKKAEEFKSGAYVLMFVGAFGLIILVLLLSGVLPVSLSWSGQWMTCLVMGALFILFIVMGVLSNQSSKKLLEKAEKEEKLNEELQKYCQENFKADDIDQAALVFEKDADELRYFKRTEQLKQLIGEKYPDLESGFLDYFVDELYPRIFGE